MQSYSKIVTNKPTPSFLQAFPLSNQ